MKKIILDTCFLINLVDDSKPFHSQAVKHLRYAIAQKYTLVIPSIVIGEYAVGGDVGALLAPGFFEVEAYDYLHAIKAAELRDYTKGSPAGSRKIIINDTQILGQAVAGEFDFIFSADMGMRDNWNRAHEHLTNCPLRVILMQDDLPPEDIDRQESDTPLLPGLGI